jgi:membrane protein
MHKIVQGVKWMENPVETVLRIGRFLKLVISRFVEDQGLPNAASLTYTTLLSLVPLMTVSLAVFTAFPVSDRIEEQIQDFIFENFMPAFEQVLAQHFQQFSQKASQLTGVGFGFLIIVALLLMATIDRALNTIWRVRRKRGALSMFMVYWAVLSLGPVLIGASMAVTSYLVSSPLFTDADYTFGLGERLLKLAPLFASAVAFTLLYALVPNRRVPLWHALAGGVVAAILFELAKRGFAFYVTHFPTYEAIYGALAVVPIFLVWLYLSWIVTLLGAEFACCLGIYREGVADKGDGPGDLLLAYQILGGLWAAQHEGGALSTRRLSGALRNISDEHLEAILTELLDARLVLRTEERKWALARDLSDVRLLDLYRVRPYELPRVDQLLARQDPVERALGEIIRQVEAGMEQSMAVPLEQLYGLKQGAG